MPYEVVTSLSLQVFKQSWLALMQEGCKKGFCIGWEGMSDDL